MIIIPAIDLKDNRCVRLFQGKMDEETVYSEDPLETARRWELEGAERLHIVDLNGAFIGKPYHKSLIKEIAKNLSIPIEVGGGVRDLETIEDYLSSGVRWIILGTVAIRNPALIWEASIHFPERIILAIDSRKGKVSIEGWSKDAIVNAIDLVKRFEDVAISSIIFTDIERDGMSSGLNFEMIDTLANLTKIPLIASGGVSMIDDIEKLINLKSKKIIGVIVGRALYNGSLSLREAIKLTKKIRDNS